MNNFRETLTTLLSNRNLMVITITQSLTMFTTFLWRPYWGLYVLKLDGTKSILGTLTTLQTLSTLFLQLPGGILSDRYGRKQVIIAASIFSILPPIIFRLSTHWTMLIPGILASALSFLAIPAQNALIADSLSKEIRATGFGAFTMAWYLTIVASYPIGGYIMEYMGVLSGTRFGLLVSLFLAVPIILIRWRYIEETVKQDLDEVIETKPSLFPTLTQIQAIPFEIWKLIVVGFLSSFGFQIFWSFVAVYCVEEVGLSMLEWSYVSIIANLVAACFMVPSGFISDRVGRKRIITISQLAVSLTSLGYVYSSDLHGVALTRLIGGVGEGLGGNVFGSASGPVWQALVTGIAPLEVRGSILGLMGTITGLLSAPAPIVGGYLYDNVSPQITFVTSFFIGLLGCLIFALWVKEPERGKILD